MTDNEKFKALMKDLGLNYHKIAKITGHTYDSVKMMLQPKRDLPRWAKLVIYVWGRGQKEN